MHAASYASFYFTDLLLGLRSSSIVHAPVSFLFTLPFVLDYLLAHADNLYQTSWSSLQLEQSKSTRCFSIKKGKLDLLIINAIVVEKGVVNRFWQWRRISSDQPLLQIRSFLAIFRSQVHVADESQKARLHDGGEPAWFV